MTSTNTKSMGSKASSTTVNRSERGGKANEDLDDLLDLVNDHETTHHTVLRVRNTIWNNIYSLVLALSPYLKRTIFQA